MPNPAILNSLQTCTKQNDCQVFGEKSFDFFAGNANIPKSPSKKGKLLMKEQFW